MRLSPGNSEPNLNGNQLRRASGVLDGADGVFRGEPAHQKRQLAVVGHQNGSAIEPPHILSCQESAAIYLDHEFSVCHCLHSGIRILGQFLFLAAHVKQGSLFFGVSPELLHLIDRIYGPFRLPLTFALGFVALLLLPRQLFLALVKS